MSPARRRHPTEDSIQAVNEVRLVGRVSGGPQERELPSGDRVVVWRLVVQRSAAASGGVDTIDCASWSAAIRKRSLSLPEGAWVEVTGCLRRRFWRAPTGAASRYEVEVASLRRVRAA